MTDTGRLLQENAQMECDRLRAENAQLRADMEKWDESQSVLHRKNVELRAENELWKDRAMRARAILEEISNSDPAKENDALRARIVKLEEALREIQEWTDDNSIGRMAAEVLNSASDAALKAGDGK